MKLRPSESCHILTWVNFVVFSHVNYSVIRLTFIWSLPSLILKVSLFLSRVAPLDGMKRDSEEKLPSIIKRSFSASLLFKG